ncbi:MAG: flagellin, partial [Ghiorsea sp.]|nr:flagellin [Ghiorsea sp.]
MALSVQTNNAAMTALKHLNSNSAAMDKSLERLSSGFRVNNAADDASGYAVASKLDGQTQRLKAASLNASQAQAMTKMADAGVNEIQNMVVRIQTLATQASSANNAGELGKLDAERIKLESAIDKIANSTNYNGVNLLNGIDAGVTFDSAFTAGTNTGVTTASITTASVTAVNDTYTLTAAANGDLTITNAGGGAQGTLAFAANTTSSLTLADGSTLSVTFGAAAAGTGGETNTVAVTNQNVANVGANTGATYATALAFQVGADNNTNNQVTVDLTKSYTTAALGLGTGDLTTQANAQA